MRIERQRAIFIAFFGILGAIIAWNYAPLLLDQLFLRVQSGTSVSTTSQGSEQFWEFMRITHQGDRQPREERIAELEQFRREVLSPSANLDETQIQAAAEEAGYKYEPKVEMSETRFRDEPGLNALRGLEVNGSISLIENDKARLYRLRQKRVMPITGVQTDPDATRRYPGARQIPTLIALSLLGLIIGGVVGDISTRGLGRAIKGWSNMPSGDRITVFFGIFIGIIGSIPFLFVFQGLGLLGPVLVLGIMVGFSALGVQALRSMDDLLPWAGMTTARKRSGIKILDTNILIDGRIMDVMRAGFLEGDIYIPGFVIQELQHIADSKDPLRRQRGRRGLDMLRTMQSEYQVDVGNRDRFAGEKDEQVDTRIINLSKALGADIVSNDYNLASVARLQNARVLSINDLAMAVRTTILPGENMEIALVREGQQHGQAVGYLEDGTMVVVEHSRDYIGETVPIIVSQVLQTERGKLIFAELNVHEDGE